jgi:predicted acetyltransferase
MIIRKIKETELMEARNISSLCFNWSHDTTNKDLADYIKETKENPGSKSDAYFLDTWAAFNDSDEMMSCISVMPYDVTFDDYVLKMAGIGGVCTYPEHRRKGAVRECFHNAFEEMYHNGVSFSYLYAFSEKFYGNFGYIRSSASMLWTFDLKTIPDYRFDGSFHLYRADGNYKEFDMVYQEYAKKYNMMVHRDKYDWDTLKDANPFKGNRSAHLYKDKSGKPRGYMIYEKLYENNHIILDCKELIFDSFTTLKALMSFAKTFSADYDQVAFRAPSCLSLDYFCDDYSQSSSSRHMKQNGMVRVINVEEVLKHAKYKGNGEIKLFIKDTFLPVNNRIYTVTYNDGKATFVKSSDIIDPKSDLSSFLQNEKIDMEMTINQFSSAIVGNYDVSDFEYQDGITLYCSKEKAATIFYSKPCWINNFF